MHEGNKDFTACDGEWALIEIDSYEFECWWMTDTWCILSMKKAGP